MTPDQMLMVGDTTFDLEMAKNAGVQSVGVSYGAHSVTQLEEYSPLAIVDCLSKLPAMLE
jgi:phosphoglycolate phosphatase